MDKFPKRHGGEEPLRPGEWIPFLGEPIRDISASYTLTDEVVGKGRCGQVTVCVDRVTRRRMACKSIAKNPPEPTAIPITPAVVKNEIRVLQYLTGLPNVVAFRGAYEDGKHAHLVMELCSGRSLGAFLDENGRFESERTAKRLLRDVVTAVHRFHLMGVAHCDLHLWNIMLLRELVNADQDQLIHVRIADFDRSTLVHVKEDFLTMQYTCGKQNDIRNIGFVLYAILTGDVLLPIEGDRRVWIERAATQGELEKVEAFPASLSDNANDLLAKMLMRASQITTTKQILEHPWLQFQGAESIDLPVGFAFLARLREIRGLNKIKRITLMVIAKNLRGEDLRNYKLQVRKMHADVKAPISLDELRRKLFALGLNLNVSEVNRLLGPDDSSHTAEDKIDFLECIAAMIPLVDCNSKTNLHIAFGYFDKNRIGIIERNELNSAMKKHGFKDADESIDAILHGHGALTFREFEERMTEREVHDEITIEIGE